MQWFRLHWSFVHVYSKAKRFEMCLLHTNFTDSSSLWYINMGCEIRQNIEENCFFSIYITTLSTRERWALVFHSLWHRLHSSEVAVFFHTCSVCRLAVPVLFFVMLPLVYAILSHFLYLIPNLIFLNLRFASVLTSEICVKYEFKRFPHLLFYTTWCE